MSRSYLCCEADFHKCLLQGPSLAEATQELWVGWVSQCFSAFNVHMNHLRILSKCRFWFSRSEWWPKVLHFEQIPMLLVYGSIRVWLSMCQLPAQWSTAAFASLPSFFIYNVRTIIVDISKTILRIIQPKHLSHSAWHITTNFILRTYYVSSPILLFT